MAETDAPPPEASPRAAWAADSGKPKLDSVEGAQTRGGAKVKSGLVSRPCTPPQHERRGRRLTSPRASQTQTHGLHISAIDVHA